MKFIVFFLTSIFVFASVSASGFKVFVPIANSYEQIDIDFEGKSINEICDYLGYNKDQFYSYTDFHGENIKIIAVIFKVFTDEIICVLTEDTVQSLYKGNVERYLMNFNLKDDFDSYDIESTLEDGVKNRSLSKEFLSDIFNQSDSLGKNSFIAEEIGYELYFKNGMLIEYRPSDGLNKWAKGWKNEVPGRYRKYYAIAARYNNDEKDILNEINIQADAFSRIPNGVRNEYIKFHTNSDGTVNYKMLMVAHYNEKINLREFKNINKGRYELSSEFNNQDNYTRTTFRVNNGLYTFDEKGKLVNSYTSN